MTSAYFYETAIGRVGIAEDGEAVTHLFFGNSVRPREYTERETPLLREAARQLDDYLRGERREFELPLAPGGTDFERQVWAELRSVPYGETRSYGQIAAAIGRPRAVRAVGRANGRNPLSIFIPCHRVIGADGRLTGYAGGLAVKERLLGMEKRVREGFGG